MLKRTLHNENSQKNGPLNQNIFLKVLNHWAWPLLRHERTSPVSWATWVKVLGMQSVLGSGVACSMKHRISYTINSAQYSFGTLDGNVKQIFAGFILSHCASNPTLHHAFHTQHVVPNWTGESIDEPRMKVVGWKSNRNGDTAKHLHDVTWQHSMKNAK